MKIRRLAVLTAAGLTVAGGAGAAIAATDGDDGKKAEDGILRDAAKDLDVSPGKLRQALSDAEAAQLDRDLDRAVKARDLTREQANQIKAGHKESGRVLGLGPGRGGPRPGHGLRRGGHHGFPGPRGFRGGPHDDIAKALGISGAKLFSELRDGKTFSQIAKAQGKSLDEVKKDAAVSAKERLDKAVKDGDLTERHAKALLEHLREHLDRLGSAHQSGPPPGHGGPGRHGGHGGPGGFGGPGGLEGIHR